jgi:hypothetical protein
MSSPPGEQPRAAATKYVLITGGVVSGLGKGVTASSVGVVLKACGLRVTCIKIGAPPPPALSPPPRFSWNPPSAASRGVLCGRPL